MLVIVPDIRLERDSRASRPIRDCVNRVELPRGVLRQPLASFKSRGSLYKPAFIVILS